MNNKTIPIIAIIFAVLAAAAVIYFGFVQGVLNQNENANTNAVLTNRNVNSAANINSALNTNAVTNTNTADDSHVSDAINGKTYRVEQFVNNRYKSSNSLGVDTRVIETSNGQDRTIVESTREAADIVVAEFAIPSHGNKLYFCSIAPETDAGCGTLWSYSLTSHDWHEYQDRPSVGWGQALINTERTKLVYAPFGVDNGLVKRLFAWDLVTDEYSTIVILSGRETLNGLCGGLQVKSNISWKNAETIQYTIYQQPTGSCLSDNLKPVITTREIAFTAPDLIVGWKTYTNTTYHFTFKTPQACGEGCDETSSNIDLGVISSEVAKLNGASTARDWIKATGLAGTNISVQDTSLDGRTSTSFENVGAANVVWNFTTVSQGNASIAVTPGSYGIVTIYNGYAYVQFYYNGIGTKQDLSTFNKIISTFTFTK